MENIESHCYSHQRCRSQHMKVTCFVVFIGAVHQTLKYLDRLKSNFITEKNFPSKQKPLMSSSSPCRRSFDCQNHFSGGKKKTQNLCRGLEKSVFVGGWWKMQHGLPINAIFFRFVVITQKNDNKDARFFQLWARIPPLQEHESLPAGACSILWLLSGGLF